MKALKKISLNELTGGTSFRKHLYIIIFVLFITFIYLGTPKMFAELAGTVLGRFLYLILIVMITLYHGVYAGVGFAALVVVIFYSSINEGFDNPKQEKEASKDDANKDTASTDNKKKADADAPTTTTKPEKEGMNGNGNGDASNIKCKQGETLKNGKCMADTEMELKKPNKEGMANIEAIQNSDDTPVTALPAGALIDGKKGQSKQEGFAMYNPF